MTKILTISSICETIKTILKDKSRNKTQIRFYKTLTVPTFLYGSETWVLRKRDESKTQSAEMAF
jgi:hypothetical protein